MLVPSVVLTPEVKNPLVYHNHFLGCVSKKKETWIYDLRGRRIVIRHASHHARWH